ncbi:MAG: ATP-dependent sacrificial sulfur transferase LarE [Deltaproteobacteria bacterium]|nr:ATP-dependent sacrificial sulfur transferase LarE [Deltaproteobacteria bacterium]
MVAHKLDALGTAIARYDSALVAFSGGVDSTLVLKVAYDMLRDHVVAVTAVSASLSERERKATLDLAASIGATHLSVDSNELNDPNYAANPTNRCYFCKSELYDICAKVARERGLAVTLDGLITDDLDDDRPGRKAAAEHRVVSPLLDAGFTKDDVRAAARALGLPNWDKPATPCLSSRVPHGRAITLALLREIELCEEFLRDRGFGVVRVRHLGDTARLELGTSDLARFDSETRTAFERHATSLGFAKIIVDENGYQRGGADLSLPVIAN